MKTLDTKTIKQLVRQGYAWPGGYEIFFNTDDGATLTCAEVRDNWRAVCSAVRNGYGDGWRVIGYELACDIDEPILSEYGNWIVPSACLKRNSKRG